MEHLICTLDELKTKGRIKKEVLYRDVLVIYSDEKIYAIMDKCPHQGVSLATGRVEGSVIKCKDHGLGISMETGQVLSQRQIDFMRLDKNSRSITIYKTVIKDGNVYVVM